MRGHGGRPLGEPKHRTTILIKKPAYDLLIHAGVNIGDFVSFVATKTYGDPIQVELGEIRKRIVELEMELAALRGKENQLIEEERKTHDIKAELQAERLCDAYQLRSVLRKVSNRELTRSNFRLGFDIDVDAEKLYAARRTGKISDSSPLEDYLQFSPRIIDKRVREQARSDYLAELRNASLTQEHVEK